MITKSIKLLLIAALCTWPSVALAQLGSVPYSFNSGTVIASAQVNANFSAAFANALNRTGGTMTGTLTLSGTAANIILGSNYVSGDGDDEGISIDSSGVVTISSLSLTTLTCTGCVGATQIAATAVSAASYGGANAIPTFTVDADGRLTAASTVAPQVPVSTGITGLGTGVATWLATPSSANLATVVTDETGSGLLVFGTSPTLTTPNLGTPSAITLTNASGLPDSALSSNVALLDNNETVTGAWSFTSATPTIFNRRIDVQNAGIINGSFYDTIYTRGWAALGDDNSYIVVGGYRAAQWSGVKVYGSGSVAATFASAASSVTGTLAWGGGAAITSSDSVALLADNETVTGLWTFANFISQTSTGTARINRDTTHATNAVDTRITRSGVAYWVYGMGAWSGDNFDWQDGSALIARFARTTGNTYLKGTLEWGGGSAISSSSNVALLNAANAFSGAISTTSTLALASGQRQYWDGVGASGNTYTFESAADTLTDVVGGVTTFERTAGAIKVLGSEGSAASLRIDADEGDDNADRWTIQATTGGELYFQNASSTPGPTTFALGVNATSLYASTFNLAASTNGSTVIEITAMSASLPTDYVRLTTDTSGNLSVTFEGASARFRVPYLASSSGTRYVCSDTDGDLEDSTTACSGTDAALIASIPTLQQEVAALRAEVAYLRSNSGIR